MIKNKMNKIILLLYFLTIGTYAHARVITVDQCPVPFDFTIGDFCVLSTLGTMFIIPIIIIAGYIGFALFTAIIPNLLSKISSYIGYRLECAIRGATLLGIFGLGGIGTELKLTLESLQFNELWTSLWILAAMIFLIESLLSWLRNNLISLEYVLLL